jgi:hypothetical protein
MTVSATDRMLTGRPRGEKHEVRMLWAGRLASRTGHWRIRARPAGMTLQEKTTDSQPLPGASSSGRHRHGAAGTARRAMFYVTVGAANSAGTRFYCEDRSSVAPRIFPGVRLLELLHHPVRVQLPGRVRTGGA